MHKHKKSLIVGLNSEKGDTGYQNTLIYKDVGIYIIVNKL